jgi:predicted site-specific integrase-resolvase
MVSAELYFKTQRIAQALGVSVSTIKRWVDSGMIRRRGRRESTV